MALVDIVDVSRCQSDLSKLAGSLIDRPRPDSRSEIYEIEIAGWALGRDGPPDAIDLREGDRLLRWTTPDIPRRDVAEKFQHIPNAQQSGFRMSCGVIGLSTEFELTINALFRGGNERVRLGTIHGRHQPLRPKNFEPSLQPLMLTSLGRAGTTWVMRLLSKHPAILAHRLYPHEVKCGRYWIHMLTVLAEPADLRQSAHPDNFDTSPFWVGHHPFHSLIVTRHSSLGDWFGREYVEDLAGFCQRSIENFYLELARSQERSNPVYFAEKHVPAQLPLIVWDLYPKAREVFLVRDFRDMLCSIFAFNARRGFVGFGRDQVTNDEAYVQQLRTDAQRLLTSWRERSNRAHLVRYEDIILQPERTLEALFTYLDLDCSRSTISEIIEQASTDIADLQQLHTTSDPKNSIGRWRRDPDPQLRRWNEEIFSDILPEFGYAEDARSAA
jgi:hypothetical protein